MTPLEQAKAAGYSDDEINAYLAPRTAKALSSGYTQEEVNDYLGVPTPPPFDASSLHAHGTESLAKTAKPVTSFTDALDAGWQLSTAGLQVRGTVPDKQVAADAPWYSRIAGQLATMTGDLQAVWRCQRRFVA